MGTATAATAVPNPSRDIHTWFGLSYASYLVVPRTLLQSMPQAWQHRFTALLDELYDAFAHVEQAECYEVTAGVEREVGDLDDAELARLGITRADAPDGSDDDDRPRSFYDRDEHELESWQRVVWPTPDPVPHYNRGRTHIKPHAHGPRPGGAGFRKVTAAAAVLRACYAAGVGHPDQPGQRVSFAAPIVRDGAGWRTVIEVPDGVTADDVVNTRPEIAAGLGVAPSQVSIAADAALPRRHVLRVTDRDPAAPNSD